MGLGFLDLILNLCLLFLRKEEKQELGLEKLTFVVTLFFVFLQVFALIIIYGLCLEMNEAKFFCRNICVELMGQQN